MERPVARRKICENDVKKEEKCWKLVDQNIAIYTSQKASAGFRPTPSQVSISISLSISTSVSIKECGEQPGWPAYIVPDFVHQVWAFTGKHHGFEMFRAKEIFVKAKHSRNQPLWWYSEWQHRFQAQTSHVAKALPGTGTGSSSAGGGEQWSDDFGWSGWWTPGNDMQ